MDDINAKIDQLLTQLSQEGLLNDQFQQLMQLQDDANPNFVKVLAIQNIFHTFRSYDKICIFPALLVAVFHGSLGKRYYHHL